MRILAVYYNWKTRKVKEEHFIVKDTDKELAKRAVVSALRRKPYHINERDIQAVIAEDEDGFR